jgi:hypothetical protein
MVAPPVEGSRLEPCERFIEKVVLMLPVIYEGKLRTTKASKAATILATSREISAYVTSFLLQWRKQSLI